MLLTFLAIPMGMMGQTRMEVIWTASEQGYSNGESLDGVSIELNDYITIQFDKNDGNNAPAYYNTGTAARLYPKNSLTVTPTSGYQITGMTLTFSGTGNTGTLGASVGSYSLNSATGTWSGSSTSAVVLTNNATSGHARMQVLTVTYSETGSNPPTPTTYTVTYNANVTGTDPIVDSYAEGANVTLRAANTFTNEGYTFSEWNTQDDGDGDPYDAGDVIENISENIVLYAIWTENAPSNDHWVLTELADLTANDVFVIVGNNGSNYAMKNTDASNSGPAAIAVTVSGTELSGTVPDNIKWNISGNATDGYVFYPNGSTTTWLYCINNNNGLRIGSGNTDYNTFEIKASYIYNKGRGRYVGVYTATGQSVAQDWRSYTSSGGNIANQTFAFYKKVTGDILPPSISANDIEFVFDATGANIPYTINNPVEGGEISAAVTEGDDWLTVEYVSDNGIGISCEVNSVNSPRTAIVTITYTYGVNQTVTKDVTVTQSAGAAEYTTIPALFADATDTETNVYVTFGNWVVSGVYTNGKNVFVTDNDGNGFVIYYTTDMSSTFAAGKILSGTVLCKLKKYNGFAELLNVDADDLTITNGGTVTVADVAMANLSGVNTGALVSYENLTCSVDNSGSNPKYYLSDGTTQLQVYNALYAFDALTAGKTYNITGIYQQYNNTKEILPRSAADIVEVVAPSITVTPTTVNAPAGGENGTFTVACENLGDYELDIHYYASDGTAINDPEAYPDWISFNDLNVPNVTSLGYFIDANSGNARAAYFTVQAYYGDNQIIESDLITINQAAYPTGDQYELYSGDLVEGDYLIVYNGKAMNNTVNSNRLQYAEVIAYNDVITTDNAEIVWHIAPSGDYWTIYSADANAYAASTGTKNQATTMTDGTDDKALWTVSGNYDFENKYNSDNSINSYLRNNGTYGFACYSTSTGDALSLYKKVEDTPAPETFTTTIAGYGTGDGNWYLIASPVTVDIASNAMATGNYDLYRFNPTADLEWENYKNATDHSDFTTLEVGRGYLYARSEAIELSFSGVPSNNGEVNLPYAGLNLVGNPFGFDAVVLDKDYYKMNDERTGIMVEASVSNIEKMEGVFMYASTAGETATFSRPAKSNGNTTAVVMNLSKNRGTIIDRAIVRFGNNNTLPKFQLFENSTKLCIAQNGEEFAIASAEAQGEMPVSFKANENGQYTLTINAEGVEMNYLHLIDNMTGADIDLLQTPSYSFKANTTDYESRFRLVFSANNDSEDSFAYFNGSEWVVNGNGTLQVIDVMGRILSSQNVDGSANVNAAPGVYMIRLINGENVKTQKVVVR